MIQSKAQLADGLTKTHFGAAKLLAPVLVQGRLRLVHDVHSDSAERRMSTGLQTLEALPANTVDTDKADEIASAKIVNVGAANA